MTIPIGVRLPEELVAFLDSAIAQGRATSRAALIASALEREMRRQAAEKDAALLGERGSADELDGLVDWTGHHVSTAD